MGCTITGWDFNSGENTVYADDLQSKTVTLTGSGFGEQPNPTVEMKATGYAFSEYAVIGRESNDSTLVIQFACEPTAKRFPRTGDVKVNLTNPDGSITCTNVNFIVPEPPPPPPNARSQS